MVSEDQDKGRDLLWTTERILKRYTPLTAEQVRDRMSEQRNKYGVMHLVK